jgi:chromosome segregation protein
MGEGATTAENLPLIKKEIAVTRRVYRSGEGEYFINGVQARLKDIQELFLDTGVGAKGYSVIAQGMIDKVVNSKPEDRRLLIEDAAGVAKYKQRKKESLRKLEGAQANLLRLNDVLAEIDRSLASLERQAQKARKYKEHRSELLEKETTWGRRKNLVLQRQIHKIMDNREALEHLLTGLRAELSQCEMDLESSRVVQLTDSKIQEQVQAEVETFASDLTHHQSALNLSRQRQEDLNRQLVQLGSEKEQIEEELNQYRESIELKKEDFESLDEKVAVLTARADELNLQVLDLRDAHDTNKREAEAKRREFVSLTQKSSDSYSKIAALQERIQGAEQQLARLVEQEEELKLQSASVISEKAEQSEKLSDKTSARDQMRETLSALKNDEKETENEFKNARQSRDQAMKNLASLSSRLKSLEDLEKSREGMANGPKKVLDWAQNQGKTFTVLSDFIEVESGYDQAVEAVLGHAFERLYAQDSETAFAALHFLRENQEGSAAIQITVPNLDLKEKANYNPLRKYVKFVANSPASIQQLVECLISSVEVLEEVPNQGDIQTYQSEGISFVTKNGIWFDANQGVLFGGSAESDQASSILARKRIIGELKAQVETAEVANTAAESLVMKLSETLEGMAGEVKMLQTALSDLEIEVGSLEKECAQLDRKASEFERNLSRFVTDREVYEVQISESREKILALEESLVEVAAQRDELEAWVKNHEDELSSKDEVLRASETELQTLKIQEAGEKERKNSLNKELETEQRYLQDRERRFGEVERLLETFNQDRHQFSGGDMEHEEAIVRLTRSLTEKREELSLIRDRLEQANESVSTRMERIRELHKMGDDKNQAMNQFAIDLERMMSELNHLKLNMEEKYGVGCLEQAQGVNIQEEMSDSVVTLEMSEDEEKVLHEEVESLKEKIRRLGEVNTAAVEEYEDMQKRHEYLFKEKMDLETSIQNLNEAIEHINKTSEERFQKAFEAIATRFEKLFPIIFGGGQASLTLSYPEGSNDILEAGVEILAQPPGKKIANMTLLSGGEKALTAISLIFAIFMVKPSPFCILDEVDAPLDDSNIGKFNALVREMSAKSQFILVTHNKKTMELNDTLYGVTMEEPGVSRMVSIQLQ